MKVAETAAMILSRLGYGEREQELAKIAGYMHDIGNLVNRTDHSQSGALIAFKILDELGMDAKELATVVTAIGNHDEGTGVAVNAVAAALILADKSDVRSSRVRNADVSTYDIHDRVNCSVTHSELSVSDELDRLVLNVSVDTKISPVIDYFQIFMGRMIMCRNAANALGLQFQLIINGQSLM
jgi:metal-dependent HD superfamily phosphatase/phosphodiesterase